MNYALQPRRTSWFGLLGRRLARFAAILLLSGLLGAAMVRVAPGFGTDERLLDSRLSKASIQAIARERSVGDNVVRYYVDYISNLLRGDFGTSVSLGRPVRELVEERAAVSIRLLGMGLGSAWAAALFLMLGLELARVRMCHVAASLTSGALLCIPAALLAIGCFYFAGPPALAVAAILFPRVFQYTHKLVRNFSQAPHVFAAYAWGETRWRVLCLHVLTPAVPELVALAGVSVSMAVGAAIPVEALCDSPGIGQLVWQAALARDLPVIVNVTLLITALTLAANLFADMARSARRAA